MPTCESFKLYECPASCRCGTSCGSGHLTWNLARYVSPRKRAQRTFELLNLGLKDPLPWQKHGEVDGDGPQCEARVEVTEDIREWDYGDYEGVTSPEIRRMRREQGIEGYWDIWQDGCPGGESVPPCSEPFEGSSSEQVFGKLTLAV